MRLIPVVAFGDAPAIGCDASGVVGPSPRTRTAVCTFPHSMREARYRFTDAVRATTRAIALRMVHAGETADSPAALAAWIARTDDIRGNLTAGGYGSKFSADDLFPLFQAHVAKASRLSNEPIAAKKRPAKWVWFFAAAVVLAIVIVVLGVVAA